MGLSEKNNVHLLFCREMAKFIDLEHNQNDKNARNKRSILSTLNRVLLTAILPWTYDILLNLFKAFVEKYNLLVHIILRKTWFLFLKISEKGGEITKFLFNSAIMFIIFWHFLMVEQIFLSPQVKRSMIISNKLIYMNCLTSSEQFKTLEIWKYQEYLKTS